MRYAEKGGGRLRVNVTLGLENITFIVFFLSVGWLNRFGSVRFGSIGFRL